MTNNASIQFVNIELSSDYYMRSFRHADAPELMDFYNKPEVSRFLPDSMIPKNIEHAKREVQYTIDSVKKNISFYWAIAEKKTDKFIGGCGFHDWNQFHCRAEIAYDLQPEYWRQGISTMAIRGSIKFGFTRMFLQRITATTIEENKASNALLLKLGFKFEGMLRNYKFFKGKVIDVMMFSYTLQDFNRDYSQGKYRPPEN